MSHRLTRAGPTLLVFLAVGCAVATAPADRLLRLGDAAGAATAYESMLESTGRGIGRDELLYRAALAHALADRREAASARSAQLLRELLSRYPASDHVASARLLLRLLEERADYESAAREAQLRALDLAATNDALRRLADDLQARLGTVETDLDSLREAMAAIQQAAERSHGEAAARERDLRQLREEIDRLKAIDLEPPKE